ncbi:hypothetical protein P3342_000211 [Pyrenophora teres f. teres]|uniref:RING finger protein n=1 Tax=Pyrenophora teres f. teres TaxID=97479 RepID=A0A6S6VT23_9PLEO|nr:hypothetical protein HRS9139_04671 [Pyrenophora teres f. teres]KAE8837455.1 hypothetical protein PTNB85_04790 [Pyrenophora teres f. teres]KAE8840123.1 hypothetical protein HRS9122_06728 [Pyrenophora teres f. teres]KAE8862281.1 hypothetical protein PTNB29_04843 [Pyrenophora teres f. teres]KAE8869476.1 hypothetical protein PTNB73_04529 [Pyrenophora teres f. teres]
MMFSTTYARIRANAIRPTTADDKLPPTCPICLESWNRGIDTVQNSRSSCSTSDANDSAAEPAVAIKKCGHIFGRNCLTRWMRDCNTCPVCRIEFFAMQPKQFKYTDYFVFSGVPIHLFR